MTLVDADTLAEWIRDFMDPALFVSVTTDGATRLRENQILMWLRAIARRESMHIRGAWLQDERHGHIFVGPIDQELDMAAFGWAGGFHRIEPIRDLRAATLYACDHIVFEGATFDADVACPRPPACRRSGGCRALRGR